jgi:hypothetical protein
MIDQSLIPLDKSWIIRMGVLDIVHGYDDIETFLEQEADLSDDLQALLRAARAWKTSEAVDVGESGTLNRFLLFASFKQGLNKEFVKRGTLSTRSISLDQSVTSWPQGKLLTLDKGTSQWASAAALLGDEERLPSPPYKLQLTYEAIEHWKDQREKGLSWEPRYDVTIRKQAEAYKALRAEGEPDFVPEQAEDFCFAYTFGFITADAGAKRWPALRGHESDRVVEIVEMKRRAEAHEPIASKDHRVVQAIAMWGKVNGVPVEIVSPEAVNKSWPQFWKFLEAN